MVDDLSGRRAARLRRVEEHIRSENAHDLDAAMATFVADPIYGDTPWGDHHVGQAAVRAYYEQLMTAAPDLAIDVEHRHVTDDAIVLEVMIRGTHLGSWRGLPPTGNHLAFPLCAVYTFDQGDALAGERIYYDRALVLQQLGVLHDPGSRRGRAVAALGHPGTMGRALWHRLRPRSQRA
jgi:steroid delta-isomerase-like uncharacterized protein